MDPREEIYGRIYKITNLVNGKIYVGQTIQELDARFKNHCHSTLIISKAIKKYGKENFKIEEIETAKTKSELDIKEIYWIDLLNCRDKEVGYNIREGGNSHTKESIDKIKNYHFNKVVTDEFIEKMKTCRPNFKHSNKSKKKLSENSIYHGPKGSSEFKGIYWSNAKERYIVEIIINKKKIRIGSFKLEKNAGLAYDFAVHLLRESYGYLNFKEKTIKDVLEEMTERMGIKFMKLIGDIKVQGADAMLEKLKSDEKLLNEIKKKIGM